MQTTAIQSVTSKYSESRHRLSLKACGATVAVPAGSTGLAIASTGGAASTDPHMGNLPSGSGTDGSIVLP
jgi:hypothetical protein